MDIEQIKLHQTFKRYYRKNGYFLSFIQSLVIFCGYKMYS